MPVGLRPAGILFGGSVTATTSNIPIPQQKEPPLMHQNCTLPIRDPRIEVVYHPIDLLRPDPRNAHRHSRKQIRQIADRPRPPGSPRRVFVPRVGIGFCAFWVVAARLLMSLPGVSSIAAGWSFAARRRGIRLSNRGPFPTGCISPIPVGPFGSRDDGSNPSPSCDRKVHGPISAVARCSISASSASKRCAARSQWCCNRR
jgi:hypothetical protein